MPENDTTTPVPAGTAAGSPDEQPPAAPAKTPKPAPPAQQSTPAAPDISGWMDGKTPELTVENAAKVIAAIRDDFRAERAKLRDSGQSARNELAQEIGRAIGLVKDDEAADPAKLTEQLTATAAEARQAKVALAVYQSATGAGGDPAALLDSASFLAKVGGLDPGDTDAIAAAVANAVAANPRLAAITTAPGMKPNPAQGSSASPPQSLAERITAATAAGDVKAAMRLKASMALDPNSSF